MRMCEYMGVSWDVSECKCQKPKPTRGGVNSRGLLFPLTGSPAVTRTKAEPTDFTKDPNSILWFAMLYVCSLGPFWSEDGDSSSGNHVSSQTKPQGTLGLALSPGLSLFLWGWRIFSRKPQRLRKRGLVLPGSGVGGEHGLQEGGRGEWLLVQAAAPAPWVCADVCRGVGASAGGAAALGRTRATGSAVTRLWTWFLTLNELRGVTASDLHFTKMVRVDPVDCKGRACCNHLGKSWSPEQCQGLPWG